MGGRQLLAAVAGKRVVYIQDQGADAVFAQIFRRDIFGAAKQRRGLEQRHAPLSFPGAAASAAAIKKRALKQGPPGVSNRTPKPLAYLYLRLRAASDFFLRFTEGFS